MKHKLLLAAIQLIAFCSVYAQNVNGLLFDATNTATRDASAAFEINANTNTPGSPLYGGLLLPRVALTGTTDATTIAGTEATSLLVYNTASVSDVTPGFYYWNGSSWMRIISGNGSFPTGSGTTNYLARWITASTLGIGATYDNGTNVGIGTTNPAQAIEIYRNDADVGIRFHDPGDYHYAIGIDRSDAGKFKLNYGAGIGDADHFIMQTNGNVGIGSASPGWKLDVNGNARVGANAGQNTLAALAVSAGQGSATTYRDIDLHGSWSGGEGHAITASHATGAANIVGQIVFEHNSPGSRIKFGRLYHSGDQSTYPMELVSNSSDAILRMNSNAYTYYGPNTTWGAYLQVGGNGRVTTSASVAATNGNLHLDAADGGFATYINYYSQNNTYINAQAGSVGIGNTSPSYKLDVTGDTRTTGDFYGDVHVDDTRNVNDPPTTYNNEVAFDFKDRSTIGVPGSGTFSGNMTIAPWGDNSGDASHQINFNEGGLFWRQGQPDAATWDAWSQILTTAPGGGGTTNYLARWTSANTLGIGVTYDNGTSVGIGTTGPTAQLHTTGTVRFANYPNGILGTDGSGNLQTRSIAVSGTGIAISNGNGVAGNPTLNLNFGSLLAAPGGNTPLPTGNFGQFQIHSTYSDFNTTPAYWGWNYVQGTGNAPNATSSQWYREILSLGSEYPGRGGGGYSLELAFPRFSHATAGVWMRTTEGGTIGGWTRIDAGSNNNNFIWNQNSSVQTANFIISGTGRSDGDFRAPIFYDQNNTAYYANPAGYSNFNQLNISRDGAGECCSGGIYTLSLAESTSGSGRMAGIQFHNGGVSEGYLRLANGGARRLQLGDYQSVGMGLEMTGDFINQNVEWNQATSSNYTVGANSGQHVITNSTVTLSKSSGNATNNGYSVVLLVANVTASGNDITWANGVGGYQTVQSLGHGVAGYRVYLQRSTDNANWTTLIAGSAIVGMQVGDYYMQYSGITSMVGISGDAFKFSNNVSLNYVDNVGAGTYYYRLLFETTGYNKSGGNYLISDRALSVVEIKR